DLTRVEEEPQSVFHHGAADSPLDVIKVQDLRGSHEARCRQHPIRIVALEAFTERRCEEGFRESIAALLRYDGHLRTACLSFAEIAGDAEGHFLQVLHV